MSPLLDSLVLREVDAPPVETAPGTVDDWLRWAADGLAVHADGARADAEMLLAAALDCERAALRARAGDALESTTVLRFVGWIERRKLGEPVAYITARCGFWTLDLVVDTAVLIPRPDTETLVEWALQRLAAETSAAVLDLGTGSGAIALSIARERPAAQVVATDVSQAALDIAAENAKANGVGNVIFQKGDWLDAVSDRRFELIVSNPPYIAEGDTHLAALAYEPRLALTGGSDGLDAIRRIVGQARSYLREGGTLMLEHGADQGAAVRTLLHQAGFTGIETRRDFGGNERVTAGYAGMIEAGAGAR